LDSSYCSLADDCAHWLRHGDLDADRRELRTRIAQFQAWFLKMRLWWQRIKWGNGALLATSVVELVSSCYNVGIRQSSVANATVAVSFLIFAATLNYPQIVQRLPVNGSFKSAIGEQPKPSPLSPVMRDPGMHPLHIVEHLRHRGGIDIFRLPDSQRLPCLRRGQI
jgi:hypothetical protein